jgi:surfeit locus 1 family protein
MRFRFRPRLVPTVAAVLIIGLTCSLGRWQLNRAAEKTALQEMLESRMREPALRLSTADRDGDALRYRQVVAIGEFLGTKQIFLDNKNIGGQVGYHVITPLQFTGSRTSVLVNRGWLARGKDYPLPPAAPPPQGTVEVAGLATLPVARFLELSSANIEGAVWQNLTFERVRAKLGIDVLPVIILMRDSSPGLSAVRETPDAGVDMHRGYAFQWFALAIVVLALWLVVNTKLDRTQS